ncbi:MIZ/SP-RING zinc finger [Colletotrichum nymphaeae SA-01]|uniref:MIZ/SP-RING zinc finger n=1 Tax=Colletotrichum nymphaeae SA-01 TaxID=1460502 RepID=A0A135UTX2_9PEZI|nr:MIZ/SP-RING zinc finger [Colletotrichum nymphaeae SA-01]
MAKNLDSYISDRGGMAKLPEDGTTAPRVRLLKDAIEKADYFYIVLHQILCLWTLDTKAAQDLLGLPPDVTDSALGIVQNVLRKNENMGQDTIFFFANFPASSASGLWHTEVYRNHTGDISRFLNNLHEQWNRILVPAMRPHSGRGYPILADELRYQLKLRSPILETIFFTVTRRHTGVPDGLIADQMTALFRQDSQNDHTQMSEQEQRAFQHSLISRYKILVSQSQQQQQQQRQQQHQKRRVAHQQQQHPQQQQQQQQPPQHQQAHLQQQQDYAVAAAIAQQQTATGNLRRMSTNFSPAQARAPTPIQNSPTQGFDVFPSPTAENIAGMPNSFNQRAGPVPSQLRLLSQPLTNQPLTPTGSPHYPSMQLPHVALTPGQISPVLQAPPGGLSMSMPGLTSPTQAVTPRAPSIHPPGVFRDPPHYQAQPHNLGYQLLQQARDAEQRRARSRQLGTAQNQAQAMTQLQATNVASPRIQLHHHHHHSSPRPQGMQQGPSRGAAVRTPVMQQLPSPQPVASISHASPRGLGITQGAPSTQTTRTPSASSRPTRDAAGRLIGNLFRPPNVSIPLDRIPHTPWEPKAVGIALHQVQLRSPRRVPRELPRSGNQSKPVRFYQSIKELALGPIATPAKNCVHRLAFVVPDEHYNRLCPMSNLVGDCVPVSEYFEGSLRYRFRLCEFPVNPAEPANISESVWAVAQSYWPEHIAIMVNDNIVAVRRKQHNGQHLPVELTPYILAGTNSITVSISPMPAAQKPNMMYFMAVEVVETLSHDNIVNMVLSQGTIPADTTKQVIRSRLEPTSSDGDDELVVVGSDLSIDLADPFSATIFQIPARGVSCTHMECFDLINWLQTRPAKPRCTAHGAGDACRVCNRGTEGRPEPSLVDKWKCPLCDGDARPYSLRVDQFMEDVRKSLEAEGKLNTKTIYVRADGMWKAKEEEADDDEEDNAENRQPPAKRAKTRPSILEPEVIELD